MDDNATVTNQQALNTSVEAKIAARTKAHQAAVARIRLARNHRLRAAARAPAAPGAPAAPMAPAAAEPLCFLAHGDSWFDYPLSGNDVSLSTTDIISQLPPLGNPVPLVLNVSHWGDSTTDEMSLSKQQRLIDAITDASNWLNAAQLPDAILFSGGGNDMAGEQFCIFLNYNVAAGGPLNTARLEGKLDEVQASYLDLFAFRDRWAPGVPVFGHGYDFPIPNGTHPACTGPWLKPSFDFCGWPDLTVNTQAVRDVLTQFNAMLAALAAVPANNFVLVPTQGTLAASDWANELHPFPTGFTALAKKFVATLRAHAPFGGRI